MCRRCGFEASPVVSQQSHQPGAEHQYPRYGSELYIKQDQGQDHLARMCGIRRGQKPNPRECTLSPKPGLGLPRLGEPGVAEMFLGHSIVFIYSCMNLRWLQSSLGLSFGFIPNKADSWGQKLRYRFSVFISSPDSPYTHTFIYLSFFFFNMRILNSRKA